MTLPLYGIYGASGCGRGIMPLAREQLSSSGIQSDRLVFIDDDPAAGRVNGHDVLTLAQFLAQDSVERHAAVAIANGKVRERLTALLSDNGVTAWTVRARNAVVMDDVVIGPGALLSPFATLTSNIRIGKSFHANLYSYVEHDCVIGDFVTFAPAVKCNGNVFIDDHAYIGAGAVLRQGRPGAPLVIGKNAVVGMGAVVTSNVAPGTTVVGNPARELRTS